MFSQTVEYSLRAVVALAQNERKTCTCQELAELTQVPGPYLSKVMQPLVQSGLVRSRRGLHGGFALEARVKTRAELLRYGHVHEVSLGIYRSVPSAVRLINADSDE